MERSLGVEQARNQLGRLADEVNDKPDVVVLTRRGRPVAVLMGPAEYERVNEARRQLARDELQHRAGQLRKAVAAAGLDISLVDDAIAAALAAG
jgi:prevent-host-death family protein